MPNMTAQRELHQPWHTMALYALDVRKYLIVLVHTYQDRFLSLKIKDTRYLFWKSKIEKL